jgi:hypothetical protein
MLDVTRREGPIPHDLSVRAGGGKSRSRLIAACEQLIQHARYYWLMLAESHLTRRLFASMLAKIAMLPSPAG